MAIQA